MSARQASSGHLMHRLWTKARGHHGYNKREWKALERKMSGTASAIFDPIDNQLDRESLEDLLRRLRGKAKAHSGYSNAEWESFKKMVQT